MKEKLKNPFPLIHPSPIVIVGTKNEGKINFTTIGDVAVAGLNPAIIMISLHEQHLATKIIRETTSFSINIPTVKMMKFVDYCGVISGKIIDKSSLLSYDLVEGIPILNDSPINMIVMVEHIHQIQHRVILICSVRETYVSKECNINGTLDLSSISGLVYGLDNKYYSLSKPIGTGYLEYKKV
jgi:flavin reductase (DIM6/NTAB) family NADH-FMN oxidoreductase RutF